MRKISKKRRGGFIEAGKQVSHHEPYGSHEDGGDSILLTYIGAGWPLGGDCSTEHQKLEAFRKTKG